MPRSLDASVVDNNPADKQQHSKKEDEAINNEKIADLLKDELSVNEKANRTAAPEEKKGEPRSKCSGKAETAVPPPAPSGAPVTGAEPHEEISTFAAWIDREPNLAALEPERQGCVQHHSWKDQVHVQRQGQKDYTGDRGEGEETDDPGLSIRVTPRE